MKYVQVPWHVRVWGPIKLDCVVPQAGYNFHLVHVQPHTVPASSMAHVETNPDHHIVFDGQGGKLASAPYDTETKLDKEQVRQTSLLKDLKELCTCCLLKACLCWMRKRRSLHSSPAAYHRAAVVLTGSWPADCELGALPEPGLHAQDKLHGRPGEWRHLQQFMGETPVWSHMHGTSTVTGSLSYQALRCLTCYCAAAAVNVCAGFTKRLYVTLSMIWRTCQACNRLRLHSHSSTC